MNGDNPSGTGEVPDGESPESRTNSGDRAAMTRRRLVATGAATWATVSLAGCNYITDPYSPDEDDDETTTTTVTTQTSTTDSPGGTTDDTPPGTGSAPTPTPEETTTKPPTTTTACASIGRFAPGMEVGIHVGVYNSVTGSFLSDDEIDGVTVEFPDADFGPLDLSWKGSHENFSENGWGGKVVTTPETESGTYRYHVQIEAGEDSDVAGETISDQFTII
jgi:hypothetical protein